MEDIIDMIFHGFKVVKDLESNLPEQSPESLSNSLQTISNLFGDANDRLKFLLANNSLPVQPEPQPEPEPVTMSGSDQMLMQIDPGLMQEYWLRYSAIHTQLTAGSGDVVRSLNAVTEESRRLQPVECGDSGAGSSSSTPRHRKRKKEGEEATVMVAAARMGNLEIPPDDNYTWRKYGQKEILGSRFPRAYYRCTHQKLYKCPAKKQVQRLDEDPYTFRVTYRGSHTCQIFFTATTTAAATAPATATATAPISSTAIIDVADTSLTGNMDYNFAIGEPHDHRVFGPRRDGDGDTWNSASEK